MREGLILTGLCLLLALAAVGGLAWVVITGPVFTLDTLLLIFVCLLLAGAFSSVFLSMAHDLGLLAQVKKRLPQLPRGPSVTAAKAEADPSATDSD